MDTTERYFQAIAQKLTAENPSITTGKMMSSPGLRYENKVFAFYYHEAMVFRLGRGFDPTSVGIADYRLLAPFKTKPPLVDWFEIAATDVHRWEELARMALQHLRAAGSRTRRER
jgi:hypothetical protein